MRDATFYASSLLELHKLADEAERARVLAPVDGRAGRARPRRTAPARSRGCAPRRLLAGVRAALHAGLVDDLDWLAPAAAGSALYELASALPLGHEQRELGRRVLARLVAADAVDVRRHRPADGAGRRARASAAAAMRARVALVTELPLSLGVGRRAARAGHRVAARPGARLDCRRPRRARSPSRRLAARLIERAAREAARKAAVRRRPQPARLPLRRGGAGVGPPPRRPRVARLAARRRRTRVARAVVARRSCGRWKRRSRPR